MHRRTLSLALAALTGCTADAVDVFDGGGPPDTGPADATVADAGGNEPDAGAAGPDAGAVDAGDTRQLVCPTRLGGQIFTLDGANSDLGIEVAAAPDWTAYVYAKGNDDLNFGRTPWPSGLGAFGGAGLEFRGGGVWGSPIQLISYGDDGFSWAGHAASRDPTEIVGSTSNDTGNTVLGPARVSGQVVLQDAVHEGFGVVYAVTSADGQAWLTKRTLGGRPTGWREAQWSNAQVTYRSLRLSVRDGVMWSAAVNDTVIDGQRIPSFDYARVRNGALVPGAIDFNCPEPTSYDLAAVDDTRVLLARECGLMPPRIELHSTRLSEPGFLLQYSAGAEAGAQVAYDGRTIGVARWPDGQPGPYVQFFDETGEALTDPLWLETEIDLTGAHMDLAGAVMSDGVSSRWILGFVTAGDGLLQPAAYVLDFEGCRLE